MSVKPSLYQIIYKFIVLPCQLYSGWHSIFTYMKLYNIYYFFPSWFVLIGNDDRLALDALYDLVLSVCFIRLEPHLIHNHIISHTYITPIKTTNLTLFSLEFDHSFKILNLWFWALSLRWISCELCKQGIIICIDAIYRHTFK